MVDDRAIFSSAVTNTLTLLAFILVLLLGILIAIALFYSVFEGLEMDAGLKEIRCHAEKLGRTLLSGQADEDPASRAARLFDNLLRMGRNRPLSEAARQIDMRLRPLRRHEAALFADLEEECATLERLARAGDRASLRPAIRIFHQRRERSAEQLVSLVTGNGIHEI